MRAEALACLEQWPAHSKFSGNICCVIYLCIPSSSNIAWRVVGAECMFLNEWTGEWTLYHVASLFKKVQTLELDSKFSTFYPGHSVLNALCLSMSVHLEPNWSATALDRISDTCLPTPLSILQTEILFTHLFISDLLSTWDKPIPVPAMSSTSVHSTSFFPQDKDKLTMTDHPGPCDSLLRH